MAEKVRIFAASLLVSALALTLVYALAYTCLAAPEGGGVSAYSPASGGRPEGGADGPAAFSPGGGSEGGAVPEDRDEGAQEAPDTFGQLESEWEAGEAPFRVLDSGVDSGPPPEGGSPADDLHAVRMYIEFALFCLFPLSLAVFIIAAGCYWFYKTFIPRF